MLMNMLMVISARRENEKKKPSISCVRPPFFFFVGRVVLVYCFYFFGRISVDCSIKLGKLLKATFFSKEKDGFCGSETLQNKRPPEMVRAIQTLIRQLTEATKKWEMGNLVGFETTTMYSNLTDTR